MAHGVFRPRRRLKVPHRAIRLSRAGEGHRTPGKAMDVHSSRPRATGRCESARLRFVGRLFRRGSFTLGFTLRLRHP